MKEIDLPHSVDAASCRVLEAPRVRSNVVDWFNAEPRSGGRAVAASMGPRFFNRGNGRIPIRQPSQRQTFNGAEKPIPEQRRFSEM